MQLTTVAVADVTGKSPVRRALDERRVAQLVEFGPPFFPLLVSPDCRLIDGWHRIEAARRLGLATLEVLVADAEAEIDVVTAACRANHVLALSLSDRREAARKLLALAPTSSDRRIAALTRTSPTSVGRWRRELDTSAVQFDTSHRVGRDGKHYPTHGRRRAGLLKRLVHWVRRLVERARRRRSKP